MPPQTVRLRSADAMENIKKKAKIRYKKSKTEKAMKAAIQRLPKRRKRSSRRRGRRSLSAREKRYLKRFSFRAIARTKAESRVVHLPVFSFPAEFLKRTSQGNVKNIIHARYRNKKVVRVAENVEVKTPSYAYLVKYKRNHKAAIQRILINSLKNTYPSFLVRRFGAVLTDHQRDLLLSKWKAFTDTGAKASVKRHIGRAKNPAYHFGVWRRYQALPYITKDSKSKKPSRLKASDEFLTALRDCISSKIATFTSRYSPDLWKQQKNISEYLSLFEHITSRRSMDFEDAFTTVAVMEGSSDNIHIDGNDHGITWVLPLGDWEGGNLVIPQLGLEIPLRAGELLGFCANSLAHYCMPVTLGKRTVITMFTCRQLFFDALLYSLRK